MILLAARELERLKVQAEAAYPEECCAILLGRTDAGNTVVVRALPAINIHEEPERAYEISPKALIAAQRNSREEGLEIVGFFHSHPDHPPQPSKSDLEQAIWFGHVYAIMSVGDGKFEAIAWHRLTGETIEERRFVAEEMKLTA